MNRLRTHRNDLYELRFSPMCKPAGEVANLTQLESHTTRARTLMMWRIAEGIIQWGPREVELLYQATLDSISQAFDVFEYPISRYMLDARADVWEADLAPDCVKQAVESSAATTPDQPPTVSAGEPLLLAGEIAQLNDNSLLAPMQAALQAAELNASPWVAQSGALAYALGAWDVARAQATHVVEGIQRSNAKTVITDGPETAWALIKVYPALDVALPEGIAVKLLSVALDERLNPGRQNLGAVFVHDSRPACLIADRLANHLAILPGHGVLPPAASTSASGVSAQESDFGQGAVYDAPRRLLDAMGAQRIFGTWTRALAKTSGADDGLWLTYPDLAAGLARQRLDYAKGLGTTMLVSDSPLAVSYLACNVQDDDVKVRWLPELLVEG